MRAQVPSVPPHQLFSPSDLPSASWGRSPLDCASNGLPAGLLPSSSCSGDKVIVFSDNIYALRHYAVSMLRCAALRCAASICTASNAQSPAQRTCAVLPRLLCLQLPPCRPVLLFRRWP